MSFSAVAYKTPTSVEAGGVFQESTTDTLTTVPRSFYLFLLYYTLTEVIVLEVYTQFSPVLHLVSSFLPFVYIYILCIYLYIITTNVSSLYTPMNFSARPISLYRP